MRAADGFLYTGLLLIVGGVAAYDWRAAVIVGGALLGVAGILLAVR